MAELHIPEDRAPVSALTTVSPAGDVARDPARDLAGALHEVSNALTVVLGWIERAREPGSSPEDLSRALDVAASRAAHARAIVRSAIGAEPHTDLDEGVADVVADALTGLDPELARLGITARADVDEALAAQRIPHAGAVRQILTNLLLNALAVSPPGALVRLEAAASARGSEVTFAVIDAGPGIAPERRGSIFEAGVSTRPGGAGIGLRHAAGLARAEGGRLALGPSDHGARFELTWPLLAADPPEPTPIPRSSPTPSPARRSQLLAGRRVLLVEDDDAVVDLLDTALAARGAEVVCVRHVRELEHALESGGFDAALFDLSPIVDDVYGAVARVRRSSGDLRVVMISGTAVALPALPAGWIAAWVRKPFEVGEIVHAIAPDARS